MDGIKLKNARVTDILEVLYFFSWIATESAEKEQQRLQDLNPDLNIFEGPPLN